MTRTQSKNGAGKTVAELAKEYGRSLYAIRSICGQLKPVGKVVNSNLYDPKEVDAAA